MKIEQATYLDKLIIKQTMLKALQEDTHAFTVTFDEYNRGSDEWWEKYLFPYTLGSRQKIFFAQEDGVIAGMVGVLYHWQEKRKHSADIVWMWVQREFRGQGIARKLLQKAIEDIEAHSHIRKISLSVTASQKAAIRLYESCGFTIVGTKHEELYIDAQFYDMFDMERMIQKQ